jgi:hypothetical protein
VCRMTPAEFLAKWTAEAEAMRRRGALVGGATLAEEPGLWVPTRASVTLPLALGAEFSTLVDEVRRVAEAEGLIR